MAVDAVAYDIGNMKEIAEIDSHIVFLNTLQQKYKWGKGIQTKIDADLAYLEQKKNDKTLHLSIVGEFSCGKSTFINALLRDNLLEADLIQGTTVASTVIRYAKSPAVIVNYKDGKSETFHETNMPSQTFGGIRGIIKDLTTNSQLAAKIKEVIIEHPSTALREGISIIDTPGTNSLERWHEDVTKTAIRDISDVSIILTSADVPLPHTLNSFVKENLSDVIERCVFVVTKMDLLRQKERERQLAYIRQKITAEFGIKNPVVFPYTPLLVLGEADPEVRRDIVYARDDYASLVNQSYQTETQIYKTLLEQRAIIQVQKLLNIMDDMLSYISSDMRRMSDRFQKNRAALEKAAKRDLVEFTTAMERKYCGAFRQNANNIRQEIMNCVYSMIRVEKKKIESEFDGCSSGSALGVFKDGLSEMLAQSGASIQAKARAEYSQIGAESYCQMNTFWEEFQRFYKELDALSVKEAPDFKAHKINVSAKPFNKDAISSAIAQFESYENKWMGGGAVAGAAIGTAIFPGVGTVIGGIAGAIFGSSQADKKFSEYKSKVWSSVSTVLNGYFREITTAVEEDINNYADKINDHMRQQITDCLKAYKTFVDEKIQEDTAKRRQLEENIALLRRDASEIENRHEKIKFLGERIHSFGSDKPYTPPDHSSVTTRTNPEQNRAEAPTSAAISDNDDTAHAISVCRGCGVEMEDDQSFCDLCGSSASKQSKRQTAKLLIRQLKSLENQKRQMAEQLIHQVKQIENQKRQKEM